MNALLHTTKNCTIIFVMTDNKSEQIISFCRANGINLYVGNPRNEQAQSFVADFDIDVLLSVNYLYIIKKKLISLPKIIAFNIHGSLLPKYRGRTPHVWAIINNENEVGVTAHLIDEGCDTGDVIKQVVVPVEKQDTGADILSKYQAVYLSLIDDVLRLIRRGELAVVPQNHLNATYFGKRTPEDGKISWNWQKERIKNWVRAQSFPYPGAFTFFDGQRVIIDEVLFSDKGYSYDMPNGLIISKVPLLVKTPNGVLEITKIRNDVNAFEVEKMFL